MDGENILIIGGEQNSLLEIFNINECRITKEVSVREVFEGTSVKTSQLGCFLVS